MIKESPLMTLDWEVENILTLELRSTPFLTPISMISNSLNWYVEFVTNFHSYLKLLRASPTFQNLSIQSKSEVTMLKLIFQRKGDGFIIPIKGVSMTSPTMWTLIGLGPTHWELKFLTSLSLGDWPRTCCSTSRSTWDPSRHLLSFKTWTKVYVSIYSGSKWRSMSKRLPPSKRRLSPLSSQTF